MRHNLEGVEMGVVVGKGDDITQLQVLGRYVPGGAAGLKMKSGTAVPLGEMARDGTADADEPPGQPPATVPEADAWAIAVLAEPPLHGLVSGCLQKAGGGGLHMGLLADTDGRCLAALAPGVAVAMLPTSSPVAAAVRIFDVVGATPLPGTKQVSVVLAERKE
ncbi:MAG: hypothetical protein RBU25_15815 [Lentisphaeria bacterium]|nr:hypothetical protein [Lentisphaeria bacterium]